MRIPPVGLLAAFLWLSTTAAPSRSGTLDPQLVAELERTDPGTPVSVIVHLVEQAPIAELDRSLHETRASRRERHRAIVTALQSAAIAQRPLQADLEERIPGGAVLGTTSYWISNMMVVLADATEIRRIAARPDVDWVESNFGAELVEPVTRGNPTEIESGAPGARAVRGIGVPPGIRAVRAPEVWYELGYDGAGRLVANLDTGVDGHHPALETRWRGHAGAHPWQECWLDVLDTGTEFPTDSQMHGTHVMGTITGLGAATQDSIGVAPGARWIASNAIGEPAGPVFDNDVITAYQWFMDPDGDPGTVDDVPDVVQNSWRVHGGGAYFDCDPRWWVAIDNCEAAGVVTTWSAGNEGPDPRTIGSPADRATTVTNAFSVGAVDATHFGWPYPIAAFSSRGPTECAVPPERSIKPEVVAPGVDVYSSIPGGGYQGGWNGTSMSGPHVAGVVALVRQANPDLDVASVKAILMQTARDEGDTGEDNAHGWGFIDAYEAVQLAVSGFGHFEGFVRNGSWNDVPLPGVRIELSGTEHVFRTDGAGRYAGSVAPGTYLAVARLEGFLPASAPLLVTLDAPVNLDFSLIDAAGPLISDVTDLGHAPRADAYPIEARAQDYSGIALVELFYRANGSGWGSVQMGLEGARIPSADVVLGEIPAFPAGSTVDYYVRAEDGVGFARTFPAGAPDEHLTFLVTNLIYDYAMEDPGDSGWTLGVPGDDATGGVWVREDPVGTYDGNDPFQPEDDHTVDPATKCFVTGNGTPGGYIGEADVDGGCTTLLSPVFDLSGAAEGFLSYYEWYAQAAGNNDNFEVRVSADGGASWVLAEVIGGSPRSWMRTSLRIGDYIPLTSTVRVRFRACDQLFQSFVEAAVDDFSLESFTPSTSAAGEAVAVVHSRLEPTHPNPAHPPATIRFRLSNPGWSTLTVFDVAGRRVRTLLEEPLPAGSHAAPWDGRDDRGAMVANGVYFYRLESGAFRQSRRLSLVR